MDYEHEPLAVAAAQKILRREDRVAALKQYNVDFFNLIRWFLSGAPYEDEERPRTGAEVRAFFSSTQTGDEIDRARRIT